MNMKIVLPGNVGSSTKARAVTAMSVTPATVVAPTIAAPKVTVTEVDLSEVRAQEPGKVQPLPMLVVHAERGPAEPINNVPQVAVDAEVKVAAIPSMEVMRQSLMDFQQVNPGVKFVYVRAQSETEDAPQRYGGLTVAWMFDNAARGLPVYGNTVVVRVSMAWCNPREAFNKVIGRYIAMKEFKAGHYAKLQLKNPNLFSAAGLTGSFDNQLRTIFGMAM